ncbi:Vba1p [Sugiyamaella lignohabitans]|uniref:Vba1p n=1 Tax=Sugiyamaella lignohabitans TaxID=796027 RepID=A0A167D743_9ASCO|nr:Vba1p [Sugiyamaella lignohabitans]ANB12563.1 Vba1p [Sugiyamaella lignohabitans]
MPAEEESSQLLGKKTDERVSYNTISASSSSANLSGGESSSSSTVNENVDTGKPPISGLRFVVVCLSLYFGVFVAALDGTVVTSLLSHIASDLNELPRISWIATGYLVACAAFQPLYGKLSDIFGRKDVLMFCNIAFGAGCLMCGYSNSFVSLVLGRIISGVGGGGMLSLSTIALSDLVSLRQRGVYQGFGNIAFGIGAGVGGIFGGIVTSRYGWRMAFNSQVPAVLISSLLVAVFTPQTRPTTNELVPVQEGSAIEDAYETEHHISANTESHNVKYVKKNNLSRVDFSGSFTLVSSLIFLMLAISTGGRQFPWTHPFIVGCFATAFFFVGLFVYIELKVAKEPVLPLQLFTHRTIVASATTNMFMTMSVYGVLFFVPVCLTSVYDMNPTQVGQRLISNFVGVALGSFGAGLYMKSTGKYYTLGILAPLLYIVGITVICLPSFLSVTLWQHVSLFINGTGYAAMLTVTLLALIAAVPHEFQAVTTSIQYAFRGIGSTLGVSIASSIFQNTLASQLRTSVTGPDAEQVIQRVLGSVEEIRKIPIEYQPAVIASYNSACIAVFVTSLVLAVVGTITSALMEEHELHSNINRDEEPQVEV